MYEQRQDNLQEPIYNSSVLIQDVALKTYWERWTIETGGDRGRSVLAARHDDADNDEMELLLLDSNTWNNLTLSKKLTNINRIIIIT